VARPLNPEERAVVDSMRSLKEAISEAWRAVIRSLDASPSALASPPFAALRASERQERSRASPSRLALADLEDRTRTAMDNVLGEIARRKASGEVPRRELESARAVLKHRWAVAKALVHGRQPPPEPLSDAALAALPPGAGERIDRALELASKLRDYAACAIAKFASKGKTNGIAGEELSAQVETSVALDGAMEVLRRVRTQLADGATWAKMRRSTMAGMIPAGVDPLWLPQPLLQMLMT
jgi:hypothetical protein